MFWGIGFGVDRIGLAALRFPRAASVGLVAFLLLVGITLPKLSFDDDIHRVFLSDSSLSQAHRAYEDAQSPPLSTALIHITTPDPFDAQMMTALRDLSLDLEFLDGVTSVASPFILRQPPTADLPSGAPLFGTPISPGFADDLAAFDALDTGLPTFINDARTAMLLSVSVNTDQTPIAAANTALKGALAAGLPKGLAARITGEDVISAEIVAGLKDNLLALNLWGALVIAGAAIVLLRDLRMALLAVVPALLGAAGVLALTVWLGYPVTVLSNVIPILLLVLGVADGVHLTGHLKDHGSLEGALKTVGPACALTALTTALAFASVTLTGNAQLFEFGVLGALGALLSFGIVIVTFTLLGPWLPPSRRPVPPISAAFAQRLITLGGARPRITIATCLLILGMAASGFSRTTPWFPLYQNLPDTSATSATNDAIAEDFGGVFQMIVETDSTWAETQRVVTALEAVSPPKTVLSEVSFARWLGHPDTEPTPEELATLPTALAEQLRKDTGGARIFIALPEPMRSADTLAQFDLVYETAIAAGASDIIGLPAVMRHEAVSLIGQLSRGLVAAALGATLLVAVAFRSARLVPVLIIPNILPLMVTGASLHFWAQGQLSPTAVLALTIAFGIAIDDTVHFLSRFADATAQGRSPVQAVKTAGRTAGQVMVLTTLLLTIGLSVTLVSDFIPIRLFGGMMIVTLWAALLTDLLLLPAMLTWKRGSYVFA